MSFWDFLRGLGAKAVPPPDAAPAAPPILPPPPPPPAPAITINEGQVAVCWPTCKAIARHAAAITAAWQRYGIVTRSAAACWMAQCGHESGDGNALQENGYYSSAARILAIHGARGVRTGAAKAAIAAMPKGGAWPPIALAEAGEVVGKPVEFFDRVYGGLLGNGPDVPGHVGDDGSTFAGSGDTQLTGRTAFTLFGKQHGLSAEDAAVWSHTPEGGAMAAAWFYRTQGLLPAADDGDFGMVALMTAGKQRYGIRGADGRTAVPPWIDTLISYSADRLPRWRRCAGVFGVN